jgi:sulfatase modifying factor 1
MIASLLFLRSGARHLARAKSPLMNRHLVSLCLFGVISLFATSPVTAVTIATVPVGSPGNAPDPATGSFYGAVPYKYNIATYDVTDAHYTEFLNAKASAADPYGLWNSNMGFPGFFPGFEGGAIARSGSGPYSYSVKPGYANKPLLYVSWYEAVRFVNWLQNGQGNGDTESGTYTITNGGDNSGTVLVPDVTTRTLWANTNSFHWLLPSDNEWYKAAYYNSSGGTYYSYPFQSSTQPVALAPPGSANSGNFSYVAYNYDGSGSYLTDVGAYPNSVSPFGAFDMGDDVADWNDTPTGFGSARGVRGGAWNLDPAWSGAAYRQDFMAAADVGTEVGFRVASVASVPEPSTELLAVVACGLMWWKRKSFRRLA